MPSEGRWRPGRGRRRKQRSKEEVKRLLLCAVNEGSPWRVRKVVVAREQLCKTIRFRHGLSALHVASKRGHAGVVNSLLRLGFNPNDACAKGFTALHYGVIGNSAETVKELLMYGADKRTVCKSGHRAEDLATAMAHCDIARLIARWVSVWDITLAAANKLGTPSGSKRVEAISAVDDLRGAIVQKKKHFGETHPGLARTMEKLVALYEELGRLDDAIALQEEVVSLLEKHRRSEKGEYQRHSLELGRLYFANKSFRKAEHAFASLQATLENAANSEQPAANDLVLPSPNYSAFMEAVICLAHCQRLQNKLEKAEKSLSRAVELVEEGTASKEHPKLVRLLLFLGDVQRRSNKHEAARASYKRAVSIADIHLGPDHVDVATCIDQLAYCYFDTKNYAQAEALFRRSLDIRTKCLDKGSGPAEGQLRTAWNNLALSIKRRMGAHKRRSSV